MQAFPSFMVIVGFCFALLAPGAARAAGPVVGWGSGAPPPFSASAIAVGFEHYCAIDALSGAVICWGSNGWGQATPPSSVNGTAGSASAITAGYAHSCAIQAGTGAVVCWGNPVYGAFTPPPSVDGTAGTASAIAAGGGHSCAIQAGSGAVVCWVAGVAETPPPLSVNGTGGTASAIAAGGYAHSCAIQTGSGAVVCWGNNNYGQATPPPSVDGTAGTASAIAAGGGHSCAIQAGTGAVICWNAAENPPASVNGTAGTASGLAAGGNHSCAIATGSGKVVCWGYVYFEQVTPPASVDGTEGIASAIAAGLAHSCAIRAGTGAVVCWGRNLEGQATPPASVNGTAGTASAIAAGGGDRESFFPGHSCAIQGGSGAVVCWGDNDVGQATPPPAVDGTAGTATAIAAGESYTCAIQAGTGAVVVNPLGYKPTDLDHVFTNYEHAIRQTVRHLDYTGYQPFESWDRYPITAVFTCRGCVHNCRTCGGGAHFFHQTMERGRPTFKAPELVAQDMKTAEKFLNAPIFIIGDILQHGEDYARRLLA
jgi:hypothetical protein